MEKFIKPIVLVFALIMPEVTFSQIFGVKAGLNLSDMHVKDDEDSYSDNYKLKPGFHTGATAEFPLTEIVSFETGLLLSTKGFKVREKEIFMGETGDVEGRLNLFYLDVPITAKASYNLGGAEVYGVLGPYLGIGLSGKSKRESTYVGEKETQEVDVKWGSDELEDDLKRLDFGLLVGAGVEICSMQVGLSYGLGLANISSNTEGGTQVGNRVLAISAGYKFGEK